MASMPAETAYPGRRVPWNMARMPQERPLSRKGWFHMDTSDKYREFAEECERLAKQAKSLQHQRILEEMARVWRQLAQELEPK
jgi:hypothetical protein